MSATSTSIYHTQPIPANMKPFIDLDFIHHFIALISGQQNSPLVHAKSIVFFKIICQICPQIQIHPNTILIFIGFSLSHFHSFTS